MEPIIVLATGTEPVAVRVESAQSSFTGAPSGPARLASPIAGGHRVFVPTHVRRLAGGTIGRGDFPDAELVGSTARFNVYVDPSVGPAGPAIGQGLLATCERACNTIQGYFAGIVPPLPFNIVIATGVDGARHATCASTDVYCAAKIVPTPTPSYSSFLAAAEIVEVFSDTQDRGWDCGASIGEGLSRVLATALYPLEITNPGFATAASWLNSGRPDWVNSAKRDDTDPVANGCSVLFLNYLRYQLGFTWNAIVAAGGPTLVDTYTALTADSSDPFRAFASLLAARFPVDQPAVLTTDNPFPLGA